MRIRLTFLVFCLRFCAGGASPSPTESISALCRVVQRCGDEKALEKALCKLYYKQIHPAVEKGLAAAVYTQLSDVETEMNGLITYDRHVVKLSPDVLRPIVTGLGEAPEDLEDEEFEEEVPVEL